MALHHVETGTVTMPFEKFWTWLQAHSNCILRAGTPDVLLFDHDDYHWHLAIEDNATFVVQIVRGKDLVGELVLLTNDIAYVQSETAANEETLFECIVEAPHGHEAVYHFVLTHAFDDTETPSARRWTH